MGISQRDSGPKNDEGQAAWTAPSEPQSHTEHAAALEATLFRKACDPYELVLELDAGKLHVRAGDGGQDDS